MELAWWLINENDFCSFFLQILAAMRRELANSGLSEEEILAKTMLLQKALAGDNSPAFVNKTIKSALQAANISTEDLAKVRYISSTQLTQNKSAYYPFLHYRF